MQPEGLFTCSVVPILSHWNQVRTRKRRPFKSHFKIIFPSTFRSFKWCLPLFFDSDLLCVCHRSRACHMPCINKCTSSDISYVCSAQLYTVYKLGPAFIQIGSDSTVAGFGFDNRVSFPGTAGKIRRIVKLCISQMYRFKSTLAVMCLNCTREVPGLNLARNIRYSN